MSGARPLRRWSLLLLAGLCLAAACGGGASEDDPGLIEKSLADIPGDAQVVWFTNWVRIRSYLNYPNLTSHDGSAADRTAFALGLVTNQAPGSGFGVANLGSHAGVWSWDSTDLKSEEMAQFPDGSTGFALQFRDDFDRFGDIEGRFQQYGFQQSEYGDAKVYTHAPDPAAEWQVVTDPAIVNAALLEDSRVAYFSTSLDTLHHLVDAHGNEDAALPSRAQMIGAVTALGDAAAGVIIDGAVACRDFSPGASAAGLHPYSAFGASYRYDRGNAVGVLAFQFASDTDARADLDARRNAATLGVNKDGKRYLDEAFTVTGAVLSAEQVVIAMKPLQNEPRRVFDLIRSHDAAFAACSS